jgi:hypothetical protein
MLLNADEVALQRLKVLNDTMKYSKGSIADANTLAIVSKPMLETAHISSAHPRLLGTAALICKGIFVFRPHTANRPFFQSG